MGSSINHVVKILGNFQPPPQFVVTYTWQGFCNKMVIWLTLSPFNCPRGLWMIPTTKGTPTFFGQGPQNHKPGPYLRQGGSKQGDTPKINKVVIDARVYFTKNTTAILNFCKSSFSQKFVKNKKNNDLKNLVLTHILILFYNKSIWLPG